VDEKVLAKVREMVLPQVERHGAIEAWIIDDTGFFADSEDGRLAALRSPMPRPFRRRPSACEKFSSRQHQPTLYCDGNVGHQGYRLFFRTSVMAHQYWGPYHLGGGRPPSWVMMLMERCGLWGTTARKIGFLTDRAFPYRLARC
jgi:hypothetical protein